MRHTCAHWWRWAMPRAGGPSPGGWWCEGRGARDGYGHHRPPPARGGGAHHAARPPRWPPCLTGPGAQHPGVPALVDLHRLGLLRAPLLPALHRARPVPSRRADPGRRPTRALHGLRRPGSDLLLGHERRHARLDLPGLLQAQDRQDLRRHAVDATRRGRRGAGRAQLVRTAGRPLLGRLPHHHGHARPHRLALGRAVLAGGGADQPGLRRRRHGRHHVHADLAGLRHGLAGLHPPVPLLGHLLPDHRVPGLAAGGGALHPALPGGRARPRRRPGHLQLDPAGPHRLPGDHGHGRGDHHPAPSRAAAAAVTGHPRGASTVRPDLPSIRGPDAMNIVVSNVKGGVGKTTTAVYLSAVAARRGRGPILLVDADPQGSTAEWYETEPFEGVELIEGPSVRTVTKAMNQDGGIVVVDTPPGEGNVVQAALARADAVVIPTRAGGVEPNRVVTTLEMTPRNIPAGVVICSARLGTNDLEATIEWWTELKVPVWGIVPERVSIASGPAAGLSSEGLEHYGKVLKRATTKGR